MQNNSHHIDDIVLPLTKIRSIATMIMGMGESGEAVLEEEDCNGISIILQGAVREINTIVEASEKRLHADMDELRLLRLEKQVEAARLKLDDVNRRCDAAKAERERVAL
ncbi:MAG: hypothetical protein V1793_22045 [Pseudomonadota bacterium]